MYWADPWALGASMWKNAVALQETAWASEAVIRRRQGTIQAALNSPLDADLAELGRMVPEKIAAFSEAGTSLFGDWIAMQGDVLAQMQDLSIMAMAGKMPSAAAVDRVGRRANRIMTGLSNAGGRALKPIHATATANQRRLRKAG